MKAILFDKKSNANKLTLRDVENPIPKDDEILVEMLAASVNAADYRMMQMGFAPKNKIFGADVSGIVEAIGKNVSKFKPGDQVIGELSNHGFGGFAQYVAAPENAFVMKPKNISFEEAAALPLAATTALQAVRDKGLLKNGNKVLIIGCSGGVGSYALQIAKYYGANVTGVCSTKNEAHIRSLGADEVIDYSKTELSQLKDSYDLVLGVNGSYPLRLCKRLLKPHGRYVMIGGSLGHIFKSIFFGWIMSLGSRKMDFLSAKSNTDDLEFISKLAEEGRIRPMIDKIFGLGETADAIRYITEHHAMGKVIIKVK